MNAFYLRHWRAATASLSRLFNHTFATLMTISVIAIALLLPTTLYLLLQNLEKIGHQWNQGTQISLFLRMNVSQTEVEHVLTELRQKKEIATVEYISPQQGLKDFEKQSGLSEIFSQLPDNPLPAVIEVYPVKTIQSSEEVKSLQNELQKIPEVMQARLDMDWLERLFALIQLGQHATYALMLLLSFAVLLVVGNTIRLSVQNRRKEIEVIKLVGGTHAFIRRPFLYAGLFYGLFGSVLTLLLVDGLLIWLQEPVTRLVKLYGSEFYLQGLSLLQVLILLGIGGALGFLSAWIT
ncbi:MAG: cell division protein FtsX, partial [Proteobacteria bacterium]|nr:cell division protein FtsX [Pseudomonadota bacterium]